MTTYVDFEYYSETYHGSVSNSLFNSLVIDASKIVDRNVNKELEEDDITEDVKYVVCKLVDLLNAKKNSDDKSISSISIDGVSKTYKVMSESEYKNKLKDVLNNLPQDLTRYL